MDRPPSPPPPEVVGLILAAGAGRRFEAPGPKLLARIGSEAVVDLVVDACRRAAIGPLVVVDGAVDLSGRWPGTDVTVVHHGGWRSGMASSLRAGIEAIAAGPHAGAAAVVVGLGDQPGVPPEAWSAVAGRRDHPIVTATFGGRRRPPVRLDRSVWELLPVVGEEGARALMRRRPELVGEVACAGDPTDVDTLDDLRRWN